LPGYAIQETVSVTDVKSISNGAQNTSADSALELLLRVRGQFLDAFSNGLAVLRFQATRHGEGRYLLGTQSGPE
jgi:hypothetical protein